MSAPFSVTTTFSADGEVVRAGLPELERELGVGDVIAGRYEIRELLGHGGCGYVYAVYDRELEVEVALKTLRPDIRMAAEAVAQLKREIQLARKVTHANVCRIFDVGFHDDGDRSTAFFTMEKIAGRSLGDRLARDGPLGIDELEPLARQLVSGLDAAHRAGVVHADLKPANIMLAESGDGVRAVITDFGLATAHSIELDRESYVLGTPAYMAPEQVESEPLSPATDYYALGCTLYHAATGDVPFCADTAYATAAARLDSDPEPPGIDRRWDELIGGLLRRAPGDRLDAAGVIEILAPRRWWRWIAAAAAVLAIAAVAAAVVLSRGRAPRPGPIELSLPDDPLAVRDLLRGEAILATGPAAAAAAILERAVARADHPRIHAALAAAYSGKQALRQLDRAVALADALPEPERRYYEAIALRRRGKLADAAAALGELSLQHPGSFEVDLALAGTQSEARSFDLARATFDRLEPRSEVERLSVLRGRAVAEIDDRNFAEGLRLTRELAAGARRAGYPLLESRALVLMSRCQRHLGDLEGATRSGKRGLELALEVDDPREIADSRSSLVALLMTRHRYGEALAQLDGREAELRRVGLRRSITKLGITRAEVLADSGRTAEALALLDDSAVPTLRRDGDVYWEGYALLVRSQIRRSRGELDRALADCRAGHAIFRGIDNERLAAFAQTVCGAALIDAGSLDEAAAAIAEAIEIRDRLELEYLVAQNRIDRGELALARGHPASALAEARAAADFFAARSLRNDEASARELAARAAWRAGDGEAARAQIAAARQRVEGEGVQLEHAIGVTEQVIDGGDQAAARIADRVAALRAGGYVTQAIESELARAEVLRRRGDRRRADAIARAARAEAAERDLAPFRYVAKH